MKKVANKIQNTRVFAASRSAPSAAAMIGALSGGGAGSGCVPSSPNGRSPTSPGRSRITNSTARAATASMTQISASAIRQPIRSVMPASSGRNTNCPVATLAVRMPTTRPRRAANQRAATVAPSTAPILAAALGTLRDAAKTRVFWILFATFFICGASTNGLIQVHLIPMCLDFGIPQVQAASLLAAMGVFDFFGTIVSGWLSDRYDNRWLLFWYYGLRGLSLLALPFTDFSFYGLSLFAMFYGLDWIATVPPTVRLTAQRFGPERANLVFGWIFAGHQLGAAFAAFGAGLSRTMLATYLPAFFIAGALCVVAALIVLAISRAPNPVAA